MSDNRKKLEDMTLKELKADLARYGAKVSGRKQDLIDRYVGC